MATKQIKGHYECPRCNSTDVFESQETTGAMAFTLNTPGPVDPTIINPIKSQVYLCRNCGEKAKWIPNARYIAAKLEKETRMMPWVSAPFAVIFTLVGLYVLNEPWLRESPTGIGVGLFSFLFAGLMALVTFSSFTSRKKK